MKPETAARKLGIHLPATPEEFSTRSWTPAELHDLQSNPPPWLVDLRQSGPHPRPQVAAKLAISNSGLARGGVGDALTTAEIAALLEEMPAWLLTERETQAGVRAEQARLKARAGR